jgi:hypothetical protein
MSARKRLTGDCVDALPAALAVAFFVAIRFSFQEDFALNPLDAYASGTA